MKKIYFLLFLIFTNILNSQVLLSNSVNTYTQNFDAIGNTTTATLPNGFVVNTTNNYTTGLSATTQSGGTSGTGILNGTSTGGCYNFANGVTATSTDRALGFLTSGSYSSPRNIILAIQNTGTNNIKTLTILFDYEKYRSGSRQFDWTFFHGTTSTAVNISEPNGNQSYPADATNTVVSNPPTTISKNFTITVNIPPSGMYYLCWTFKGLAGSTNCQAMGIDNINITANFDSCSGYSTWNGTSWSTSPTLTTAVIIDGNYDTSTNGNIDACSVIVNTGKTLTIPSSNYVNIQNELTNNGTVNINNGSLVQVNNSTNIGNINYNRSVNGLHGYDYIYWSSPVNNQILSNLYTTPTMGNSYEWNTIYNNTNGTQGNWVPQTSTMINDKGYIIRSSSSYGWNGSLTSNFSGTPNNGIISTTIQIGNLAGIDDNWNLVGNPYPSPIKIIDFLFNNTNINGYVSLWQHTNEPTSTTSPFYQNFQYNYLNDYLIVNGTGASNSSTTPYYIGSGQGFFISMLESNISLSNVYFTNSMRNKTYDNTIFYKTQNQNSRIWLDLLDSNNKPNRILIGYVDGATNDNDRMYDAETTIGTSNLIYSIVDNKPFVIQGKSSFNENDQVQIGINITTPGEYKMAISEVDGLFTTQNIYLQDLYLNTIYDLRQSPYTFNSNTGTFNDRFVLRYTNNTLGINSFSDNNLVVYSQNNTIHIKNNQNIEQVKVYNILGELLYDNNFNSNEILFNINSTNQALFIKIKTNGLIYTKKLINE